MKKTLAAAINVAVFPASLAFCLLGLVTLSGCSTAPTALERLIFNVTTNEIPVVSVATNATTVTNDLGAVETRNLVTWATNIESRVTYTVATNTAALTSTAGRLTNLYAPGWGELAATAAASVLAMWARMRSTVNKGKAAQVTLAQGIETLLAIIETTPQGKELSLRLKLELAKGQKTAGVVAEIAHIVDTFVDNDSAKKAAKLILDSLPQENTAG